MASSVGGTVRPRIRAVLRLITSSYLFGRCTGRSLGFIAQLRGAKLPYRLLYILNQFLSENVVVMVRIERRGLFSARRPRISDELDAHSAHTKHDHRRYEPGEDRAADHQSVGQRLADAMRHHDRTRAGRKMREDEERAEPIMRHESDVPRILDESGGRARREAPSGVDAKICPCENEDRVHVAQHIKGEVDAGRDLEGAETV